MGMRPLGAVLLFALGLAGCGSGGGGASGGAGGGSLAHEIGRELHDVKKATRSGVEVALFFDISGSSNELRKPIGKLVEQVIDVDPDAVPLDYSFFGNKCILQGTTLSTLKGVRRASKDCSSNPSSTWPPSFAASFSASPAV